MQPLNRIILRYVSLKRCTRNNNFEKQLVEHCCIILLTLEKYDKRQIHIFKHTIVSKKYSYNWVVRNDRFRIGLFSVCVRVCVCVHVCMYVCERIIYFSVSVTKLSHSKPTYLYVPAHTEIHKCVCVYIWTILQFGVDILSDLCDLL